MGEVWMVNDILRHIDRILPSIDVDTIVTFDKGGISGHANHIAISDASLYYKEKMALFHLVSHPLYIKYNLFHPPSSAYVFKSDLNDWKRGIRAMVFAHVSQMRWFRWAWILFSRYMVINELVEVK